MKVSRSRFCDPWFCLPVVFCMLNVARPFRTPEPGT